MIRDSKNISLVSYFDPNEDVNSRTIQVYDLDKQKNTGLVDSHGNAIYRDLPRNPIGYIWN